VTQSLDHVIRNVPDFPKPGIQFKDITTLLKDGAALALSVDAIAERFKGTLIQKVAGIESRGFPFGCALAYSLGAGFVPIRKKGKLPAPTYRQEYALEYGTDALEVHQDAFTPGERVLVVDDLLATGGTAAAACSLVERAGGRVVGCGFVVELSFLGGRKRLPGRVVHSLVDYAAE